MTVGVRGSTEGALYDIFSEARGERHADVTFSIRTGKINSDLSIGTNVSAVVTLAANDRLCSPGVKLHGAGFIVTPEEAQNLGYGRDDLVTHVIRDYRNGRDLMDRPRGVYAIDLFDWTEQDVRSRLPTVYQWLHERVYPERAHNNRATYRDKWWLFGEPRTEFRTSVRELSRYLVTVETSKHRIFFFLSRQVLPDNRLVTVSSDDSFHWGILSSSAHQTWALAAGGTLEDRPVYTKSRCFDTFPFPTPPTEISARIRALSDSTILHRDRQLAIHPSLTITGMYNVLEKLRSDVFLNTKDKIIHEQGLVSVLKQLHDELDAAVFDAYGWPHDLTDEQILERLVALNAERAEEERRGIVRWLRPEFQNPTGAGAVQQTVAGLETDAPMSVREADKQARPWPKELPAQIAAVREVVATGAAESWSAERTSRAFKGAKRAQVEAVLESLSALGLLIAFGEGTQRQWKAAA